MGDLFADEANEEVDDLLAGKYDIPVQCYSVMGGKALPSKVIDKVERDHGEIATNLVFLGEVISLLFTFLHPSSPTCDLTLAPEDKIITDFQDFVDYTLELHCYILVHSLLNRYGLRSRLVSVALCYSGDGIFKLDLI